MLYWKISIKKHLSINRKFRVQKVKKVLNLKKNQQKIKNSVHGKYKLGKHKWSYKNKFENCFQY